MGTVAEIGIILAEVCIILAEMKANGLWGPPQRLEDVPKGYCGGGRQCLAGRKLLDYGIP